MRQFFVLNTLSLFVRNVSNLLHLKEVQGSSRHVDSNATDRFKPHFTNETRHCLKSDHHIKTYLF